MMKIAVILPAAGTSRRFGGQSKLEQDLAGRAVFIRSIELFSGRPQVGRIILAVNPDTIDEFKFRWGDRLGFMGVTVTAGGKVERWETVRNAMNEVDDSFTHIAVHDAARPLPSPQLIDRVFEAASRHAAVIPGIPVSSTLKRVAPVAREDVPADPLDAILGNDVPAGPPVQRVVETVDRTHIVEAQTPQVIERSLLQRAYEKVAAGEIDSRTLTDEAGLIEAMDEPVHVVEGEATNLKITRPDDLLLAAAIHQMRHKDDAATEAKRRLFADEDE